MIANTHRKRVLGHFRNGFLREFHFALVEARSIGYSRRTTDKQGIMKAREANLKLIRLIRDLKSEDIARFVAGKILDEILPPPKQEYTLEEPLAELDRS